MRVATFNVESLDEPVEPRAAVLRPALERLDADILCLQEVNGQHVRGQPGRSLLALDHLLAGTRYAPFHRAASTLPGSLFPADVHNLVTLSRWPITMSRQIRHECVPAISRPLLTRAPPSTDPEELTFDRPMLLTEIALDGGPLTIINVHLRAPLAAAIPGQKLAPFKWRTTGAWAEGLFVSGLKRTGQALELRLVIDGLFTADKAAMILVAGDFNAEEHETPLKIVVAAQEETGNAALAAQAMVVLDRSIDPARRFSVLHHGRPQMLDHMLASHALSGHFRAVEVHNETLGDELIGYAKGLTPAGSSHAGLVAIFDL